jgi:cyclase
MLASIKSPHFRLEQLAEGVYAAIHEEGWAICNAGIIDLGDRTLVYDAFASPQAASDLKDAAERLTGRPVRLVINSHSHSDHIWGNQAFGSEVDIISTAKTRDLIIAESPAEVKWYQENAQEQLKALEAQFNESSDEYERHDLNALIIDYQAISAALPILQIRPPNLTFTGEIIFNGPKRLAKLITFEGGHCGSDAILHLPEDGIVFMEDILFVDCHPYLVDGDPDVIQRILAESKMLKASTFVPGHGPVGKIAQLDILDGYINQLKRLVKDAIDRGATQEDIVKIPIPKEYQHFILRNFFSTNVKYLYQRQLAA